MHLDPSATKVQYVYENDHIWGSSPPVRKRDEARSKKLPEIEIKPREKLSRFQLTDTLT
jgi:hypothetical protein